MSTVKAAPTMIPCLPVPRTDVTTHNTTRQSAMVPTTHRQLTLRDFPFISSASFARFRY